MRSAAGLALYILSLADGLLAMPSPSGDARSTGAVATGMPVARAQLLARILLPEQARATPPPTHHVQLPRSARRLRQLGERQDPEPESEAASETTSNDLTLFGTRTAEDGGVDTRTQTAANTTNDQEENTTGPVPTPTTSVSHEWITTSVLTPQSSAVPLAATMGLIMPNPWQSIYVGKSTSPCSRVMSELPNSAADCSRSGMSSLGRTGVPVRLYRSRRQACTNGRRMDAASHAVADCAWQPCEFGDIGRSSQREDG